VGFMSRGQHSELTLFFVCVTSSIAASAPRERT
jgi:hypothetical protein